MSGTTNESSTTSATGFMIVGLDKVNLEAWERFMGSDWGGGWHWSGDAINSLWKIYLQTLEGLCRFLSWT